MTAKKSGNSLVLTKRVAKQVGISEEMLALILEQVPADATDQETALFIYQISRTGLDPLSRQIYLVGRFNKREGREVSSVQTGIDGYRLVAERTGRYAGSSDPLFNGKLTQYAHKISGEKLPVTATITVKKALDNGVVGEFTATAEWDSYYPGDRQGFMWTKMPYVMLSKVAEALALRKAFPAELSGVYTAEEMAQAGGLPEEVIVAEMMDKLGVQNENALKVLEKLEDAGISEDGLTDLVDIIGQPIEDIPDDAYGNKVLYEIWGFAVALKKGADLEEALGAFTEKLESIEH